MRKEKYRYDYANKCDCSEDDKCGCSYPNNMSHNFSCDLDDVQKTPTTHSSKIKDES